MPPRRSAQDWRELVTKLKTLRDDPSEDREKRNKAEAILVSIRSNPEAVAALKEIPIVAPATITDFSVMGWDEMV